MLNNFISHNRQVKDLAALCNACSWQRQVACLAVLWCRVDNYFVGLCRLAQGASRVVLLSTCGLLACFAQ